MNAPPLTFEVVGHPEPAGSKTNMPRRRFPITLYSMRDFLAAFPIVDDNQKSKPWKKTVAQSAAGAMLRDRRRIMEGTLYVEMVFTRKRPVDHFTTKGLLSAVGRRVWRPITKPDVLKLARGVEDACTGIVWKDDAQIVDEVIRKEWCGRDEPESVRVTVVELVAPPETTGSDAEGFHVIPNHTICHLDDRPHSDRSGCPTCHGNPDDCVYGRRG